MIFDKYQDKGNEIGSKIGKFVAIMIKTIFKTIFVVISGSILFIMNLISAFFSNIFETLIPKKYFKR